MPSGLLKSTYKAIAGLSTLGAAAAAVVLSGSAVQVTSTSMATTLCDGDLVFVGGFGALRSPLLPLRQASALDRGDIVVGRQRDRNHQIDAPPLFIKRLIGVSGDALLISRGTLIRNGRVVEEPYVYHERSYDATKDSWPLDVEGAGVRPVVVPANSIFVMGDNRDVSRDSRHFGTIDLHDVIGPVVASWRPRLFRRPCFTANPSADKGPTSRNHVEETHG